MNKLKITTVILIITIFLGLSFGGCGSGSVNTSLINLGFFIDAPVQGLKYKTTTQSGYTDSNGTFKYKSGEFVTFTLGNLKLGTAIGGELISPLELAGDTNMSNISTKASNIARLLQTLNDNNDSNSSNIIIPRNLDKLDIKDLTLDNDADLGTILIRAQAITTKPLWTESPEVCIMD